MPYIFSTLTADTTYTTYAKGGENDLPAVERKILIRGGANVANKQLVTPHGVATHVDSADLAILKEHPVFQQHLKNGFVKIGEKKADPEKVAADMQSRDQSAPLVPQDFEDKSGAKPLEGKPAKTKAA